jgi:VIT1/CCC1 family predicted Fe2+/Mn2+ transporter
MKKYLIEFVYGATDGTVTTFAIIAGTVGANLDPVVVLLLGVSNVLADGFSMAASNFLSERAGKDLEGKIKTFGEPLRSAVATFTAFVIVGSVPLVPFILARYIPVLSTHQFSIALVATSLAFVFIGAVRGKVTNTSMFRGALETLIIGGIAASIAYGVGSLIDALV